jgi:CheY-like chemotaxis protein
LRARNSEYHIDYRLNRSGDPEAPKPRLLVVDDHELVVSRVLGAQFEVVKAYNGYQAFRFIEEMAFDVAIVDHDLPDTTGPEILRRLFKSVPSAIRVLMSGRDIPGIDALRSSGLVQYFLAKPLDLSEIRICSQS